MGRERQSGTSCPAGVEIRRGKTRDSIRIVFLWRGERCRETLSLEPTAKNLKYAERLRGEVLNAIERGSFDYAAYFPNSKRARQAQAKTLTVADLLDAYLERKRDKLSLSAYDDYRKSVAAHLKPTFGALTVGEITYTRVRDWIAGLTITRKRVRNVLIPLNAVLNDALRDRLIEPPNPISLIDWSDVMSAKQLDPDDDIDPFNPDEIGKILAASTEAFRPFVQFAFWTGLRTSELIALEWRDIDFDRGVIHVRRAVVKKQEKATKTRAGTREVLMLPPARAALVAQKAHSFMRQGRVFLDPRTNEPWQTDKQIREWNWRPTLLRAGVRYRYPYQTRHTYASAMLKAGENIDWLTTQMGHTTRHMIERRYGRWIPDHDSDAGYRPRAQWDENGAICPAPAPRQTGNGSS